MQANIIKFICLMIFNGETVLHLLELYNDALNYFFIITD